MIQVEERLGILCAARADQSAFGEAAGGVFTRHLVAALRGAPSANVFGLPLYLAGWLALLPEELLPGVNILDDRRDIVPGDTQHGRHRAGRQSQKPQAS